MSDLIVACDLGTGGNKASLYDAEGQLLAAEFVPYETSYPQPGWHEQAPQAWWRSVVESTRRLIARRPEAAERAGCFALSGHSLGCVPLDSSGTVLRTSTPIWSDKRASAQADAFFKQVDPAAWYRRTGNGFPAPHYTLFKIMWYRDHEPGMFSRTSKIIGTKDYVNYRLTGCTATDYSYASGLGAYDLLAWDYADDLLEAADLSRDLLPEIVPSTEILGTLTGEAAAALGLPVTCKVVCGGVDNSCMALGARAFTEGRTYASLGSSAWIAVSSAKPLLDDAAKPYVFAHVVPGMFASATAIFSCGTTLKWVRDELCKNIVKRAEVEGADPYDLMAELARTSPAGARGLLFNPSMAGGSSLDASPHIRGGFFGLDLAHTQADVVRSVFEGIALNLRIVLDALRGLGEVKGEMVVVGGGSRSGFWRQVFADAFAMPVVKTTVGQEAGSLGAAAVGAVGVGLWKDMSAIDRIHERVSVETPRPREAEIYEGLLPVFKRISCDQAELGEMLGALHRKE